MKADMQGMARAQQFLVHHWEQLVAPCAVLVVTLAVGYAVKRLLLRMLGRWAARGHGQTSDIVTDALAGPFMIWVLILGLHLATQSSALPPVTAGWVSKILLVLWIVSLTIMAARLTGQLIHLHGAVPGALGVTTLTQTLAQLAVVLLGLLLLLNGLGISITPILTALGVGGLAVALALQDTLANLFAGFYIAVAGQVRLGDYIRLNTGEEGYVADIGWRSTTIRTLTNNLIIIPNKKLGEAIVTNYYLPAKSVAVSFQVNVSREADPERVERVLLEEVQGATGDVPGMLTDPAPSIAFDPGISDWSLGFTVNYGVAEFADQFNVRYALRKRVLRRLRQEQIDLPFPTRTIFVHGSGAS